MPTSKLSSDINMSDADTSLSQINESTPVHYYSPKYIEKLMKQNVDTTPKSNEELSNCMTQQNKLKILKSAEKFSDETPILKRTSNIAKYKIRPRTLYEESTNETKIVETKEIESPKHIPNVVEIRRVIDFQNNELIKPPVSLKTRQQAYMQSRFSEKRYQRKQIQLKEQRALSDDQLLFCFRHIIQDNF